VQTLQSDNAFYFAFDPTQLFLYAVNVIGDFEGQESGSVEAYARDPETGMLTFINRQSSGGSTAAQPAVDPTGSYVVVANYNGANFTVLPINPDGSLEPVISTFVQEGSGPNTVRQDMSHPHAVVFDPGGNFIAAADLGTDEVLIFQLNLETGELTEVSSVSTAPGAGPRHVVFNADGTILYVVNELDATISVYAYDAATGMLGAELQTISTVVEPFEGTKSTAEILIHPSGLFLYNSNRGQPDSTTPEGDAIVGFSIDQETGLLTLIGHTIEEIAVPWSFDFDASGSWLYAANYGDSSITQFAIDQSSGELTFTGERTPVAIPFVIQLSKP
jgi:6-phosphogluconolactonase (cycloisomerase 2 family)